jgi:hypothetical protein
MVRPFMGRVIASRLPCFGLIRATGGAVKLPNPPPTSSRNLIQESPKPRPLATYIRVFHLPFRSVPGAAIFARISTMPVQGSHSSGAARNRSIIAAHRVRFVARRERLEFVAIELELERSDRVFQMWQLVRSKDWRCHARLVHQPREGHLRV